MENLTKTQASFSRAITNNSEDIFSEVEPVGELTKEEAIKIYKTGYQIRHQESLNENYEATWWVLGDDEYFRLSSEYLKSQPSQHSNLLMFGRKFPSFLKSYTQMPFLSELARFELMISDLFHQEQHDLFEVDISNLFHFTNFKFEFGKSTQIFNSEFPVYTLWKARGLNDKKDFQLTHFNSEYLYLYKIENKIHFIELKFWEYEIIKKLMFGKDLISTFEEVLQSKPELSLKDIESLFFKIFPSKSLKPIIILEQ